MGRRLAFWVLMLIWLIFGMWNYWPSGMGEYRYAPLATPLLLFVIIGLLGWKVFGPPIQGD